MFYNVFSWIQNWWHKRIVTQSNIGDEQWDIAIRQLPLLNRLTNIERQELKKLAILFLHYKSLEGARGLKVTLDMALLIALQASLPILNLGFQWYNGWVSVIVYPAQFVPERVFIDEYGVEHKTKSALSGESWHKGPVVLSWEDTRHAGGMDGHNLVIHEFAHKLDMLNGRANGFPPLHKNMDAANWSRVMAQAFEDFQQRVNAGVYVPIDEYAATSPAEFFAVLSEVFFERSDILFSCYPRVYEQFSLFYRQNPLSSHRSV